MNGTRSEKRVFAGNRRLSSAGRILTGSLLALGFALSPGRAASRDFAMGVSLGSPMGLTMMQNLDSITAVQAALEWGIHNDFVMQGDYLFKVGGLFPLERGYGKAWLYYGPGGRWEWGTRGISLFGPYRKSQGGRLAVRFPVGVQYYLPKVPFDVFAEVAPMLCLWRSTSVDMTIALGLRFDL